MIPSCHDEGGGATAYLFGLGHGPLGFGSTLYLKWMDVNRLKYKESFTQYLHVNWLIRLKGKSEESYVR